MLQLSDLDFELSIGSDSIWAWLFYAFCTLFGVAFLAYPLFATQMWITVDVTAAQVSASIAPWLILIFLVMLGIVTIAWRDQSLSTLGLFCVLARSACVLRIYHLACVVCCVSEHPSDLMFPTRLSLSNTISIGSALLDLLQCVHL